MRDGGGNGHEPVAWFGFEMGSYTIDPSIFDNYGTSSIHFWA